MLSSASSAQTVQGLFTFGEMSQNYGQQPTIPVNYLQPIMRRGSEDLLSIVDLVNSPDNRLQIDYNVDGINEPEPGNDEEPERRLFTTPCGQTYWLDQELWFYTNENVERPIGYWCEDTQSVVLDDGLFDSDDDDDVSLNSPSPPRYSESSSPSDEVEGETILLTHVE